jgi:hypothetical protein
MDESERTEQQEQVLREYRAMRRSMSWVSGRRTRRDVGVEIAVALIVASVSWRFSGDVKAKVLVPIVAAALALAVWEVFGRTALNYLWTVPEDEHLAVMDQAEAARQEHEAERQRLNLALAQEQSTIQALQDALKIRQKNQRLADALTRKHEEGVRDILNRPPRYGNDIERWRATADKWKAEVLEIMHANDCTPQDLHHVEVIGSFATLDLHSHATAREDVSMFAERLNRVANISSWYAEH